MAPGLWGRSPAWGLSCWSHRPNRKGAGHSSGATGTTHSEAGTHGLQSLSHWRCVSTECISTGFCHQNPHFLKKTKSISQSPLEKIPFMERIQMHGLPGHSGCGEALLWGGWHHRHPSCSVERKPQTTPAEGTGLGPEATSGSGRAPCKEGRRLAWATPVPEPGQSPATYAPHPSDGRVPLDGSVQTRRHQRLPLSVPGAYGAGPSDGSLCPVPHFLRPPQAQDTGTQVPTAWTSPWGGVSPASACDTHGPTEP